MRRGLLGTLLAVVLFGLTGIAIGQQLFEVENCVLVPEHNKALCDVVEVSTTTTVPETTTTTEATTTTTAPTTTTSTTMPPNEPDQCVIDQIAREPFKQSGNGIKTYFNIELSQINPTGPGTPLWNAPYLVDLDNGFGWISGDRAGYKGAYMFLVHLETKVVYARVEFHRAPGASGDAYFKVNDRYMDEIQTTRLGYDGTCADPVSQGQIPPPSQGYEANNDPEVRPLVPIFVDGVKVEDRSYTDTEKLSGEFIFDDGGLFTEPFTVVNGFGTHPHTVYERQVVLVKIPVDGEFFVAGVVYYDILNPAASFQE